MSADHRASWFTKDFRAAAGAGIQAGFAQLLDYVLVAHLVEMCKMVELDHGKSFEMQLRIVLFESRQQICEITEREFRIEAAGNVKFGSALLHCLTGNTQTVIDVVRVSIRLTWRAIEAAKLTVNVANVRGIEVSVYIEERCAAVFAPANAICQLTKRRQVIGRKQCKTIFKREPLASLNLLGDHS